MIRKPAANNVVTFRPQKTAQTSSSDRLDHRPISPKARRRRLAWLAIMCTFLVWFLVELIIQTGRISEAEAALAQKRAQISALQARQKQLREQIRQMQTDTYMDEMARKLGYTKDDREELYLTPK
ncbi:septum formation initiator family protein [Polycladomyces sp. WAk]|uniref:Septum formation initiator family protein n=1 Tax=Polycladomyces zharkentensis TaxID=2807616 RepID=A0ABS2WM62_9BACL|nr:septum formation initiator family protein [Polycladomyces sp. WAk]MBN2910657.1 septum formation initiator family protein [Polycladomyces sp. WAk]